ncbi:hypothetical protein BY996DRAFT_7362399 [Phakopsora pachyrhizi]|uniref:Expressed protein n=1 Tax=Phakopsora pachyrhizi TaxID=170000 RepID=A0AAV0AUT3_PHAPC|nr:hypothetical protein BY996DRAFT_7362399 [Phakopsora pachyrhizi]CAH7672855.1 expressed protein [Phakopsora pachyrhizi]
MTPKRKTDGDNGEVPKASLIEAPGSKPSSKVGATVPSTEVEENATKRAKHVKPTPGINAQQFSDSAKPIEFSIGESGSLAKLSAESTTFSTGSYGWKGNGRFKVKVKVDGEEKEVEVIANLNITVVGSKPDKKPTNGKRGRPRKNPVEDEVEN